MAAKSFLDTIYSDLDYQSGDLYDCTDEPSGLCAHSAWVDKGEWLAAAKHAGAEKIFFIKDNPVAVFAKCPANKADQIEAFNNLWCLARPRLLFLESPGELLVCDLAEKPINQNQETTHSKELKTLKTLTAISEVAEELKEFHRDNIESGKLFGDDRFKILNNRADERLLYDLGIVRDSLYESGLDCSYIHHAHALIGRSIFIRYLEDRGVLDKAYYRKVAKRCQCTEILNNPLSRELRDHADKEAYYARVLNNKKFTYELYRALSDDFNGDMFPDIADEEKVVRQKHLNQIQSFFYGDQQDQQKLFFFSYRFDIIPLELISAIYEYFYASSSDHEAAKGGKNERRNQGGYYTPPVLAEFTLSRVLDEKELMKNPRVLDPSCGSGVFIVEAFRRIVRYNWSKRGKRLSFDELKKILKDQIVGIEINSNAASVAAFSLYLAMLNYLDPPSIQMHIRTNNKLPNILKSAKKDSYNCIYPQNAFTCSTEEIGSVDIVVGNPPWGKPKHNATSQARLHHKMAMDWCLKRGYAVGDKELSQAFLWLSFELLKINGRCCMLTSAGILFKDGSNSHKFRQDWMKNVCISEVFNFTHVRKTFFNDAISPFVMISFSKKKQNNTPVNYWSPKQVASFEKNKAIWLSKYDLSQLIGQDLSNNKTWKISWFGNKNDSAFVSELNNQEKLESYIDTTPSYCGRGYQTYKHKHPTTGKLPSKTIVNIPDKYSELSFEKTPKGVYNFGPVNAYFGKKIIIKEGIKENGETKGEIISRYEDDDFSFYRSIYGIKLKNNADYLYKAILGILWSSFTRYFFFHTSANWGLWNHKILLGELYNLPVPKNLTQKKCSKLISIVNKLKMGEFYSAIPSKQELFNLPLRDNSKRKVATLTQKELEKELDLAVYDLYGLSPVQRDLIDDCCQITIPYFYSPDKSNGVQAINIETKGDLKWMRSYAEIFAKCWKLYIEEDEAIRAKIHTGASGTMLAVEFYLTDKAEKWDLKPTYGSWDQILDKFGVSTVRQLGRSQIILEGLVYYVSDESIIIIKRNEKRFWTRSLAREDAESTLTKRMLQDTSNNGGD